MSPHVQRTTALDKLVYVFSLLWFPKTQKNKLPTTHYVFVGWLICGLIEWIQLQLVNKPDK